MSSVDYRLLVVNMDDCPITDNPVVKDDCHGCEHFAEFSIRDGLLCASCCGYDC